LAALAGLTGELAQAREAVAGRLRGIDPGDLPAQRRAYEAFSASDPLPEGTRQSEIELGGVHCLGLIPNGASDEHVLFWLHGGGFAMGSSVSHRAFTSHVAASARCAVVLPDYRLSPEHPYPAALDDAFAAYKAMLGEGVDPSKVVVAGDSAGGGLAIALMLRLKAERIQMPAGLALLSPWIDYAHTGWSVEAKAQRDPFLGKAGLEGLAKRYLGAKAVTDADVQLLNADMRGLPPTLIQVGEAEILLSDSTRLAERLGACGAPVTLEIWPDMFHVFQARFTMLSQARQALDRIGKWTGAHLRT
jgi:acetyl esterase/lipase